MKKNVLTFGIISGIVVSALMATSIFIMRDSGDFSKGEIIGYTTMLIAFAFIFVGIKNYRDKIRNFLMQVELHNLFKNRSPFHSNSHYSKL